ncbi:Hypothetical_protein [Hexamita inflata]|uniref:Hypothetical_protein n=1 Tax=Hexamita inflata TaxID=28002 RepID=A0AA86U895_9EUKA|nr:Hypothetical protein HINF_LOCUS29147 [Hexamita inflata]
MYYKQLLVRLERQASIQSRLMFILNIVQSESEKYTLSNSLVERDSNNETIQEPSQELFESQLQNEYLCEFLESLSVSMNSSFSEFFDVRAEGTAEIPALFSVDDGFIRLRFSFRQVPLSEMRLGQIGCGRQNPPIQSAELTSKIVMAKEQAINEPSGLESGNRSIASLETQMVRRRWIPVQIGLHEAAALRAWTLVPESLVALAAEVRLLLSIAVSKTNDHLRGLTVPVQKTELVQTKVK